MVQRRALDRSLLLVEKVISLLQNRQVVKVPISPNVISAFVRVNRFNSPIPEFQVPWSVIENICKETEVSLTPHELVKILKNQGLPTAEGFTDIQFDEKHGNYKTVVFSVDKHVFSKIILFDISTNDSNLTKDNCLFENVKKKNIVIQCSFPAIAERCHMTHFRSAVRSQFMTNLNRFVGHNVKQVIYVNDWGYDAATVLTGYNNQIAEDPTIEKSALNFIEVMKASRILSENDLKFNEKVQRTYEKMQKGDPELSSNWEDIKSTCMNYYNRIYEKIGVHFDGIHFDSSSFKQAERLSFELLDKNLITEKDDCISLNFPIERPSEHFHHKVINSCDASLYHLSRCLTAALEIKKIYNFDAIYNVGPKTQKEINSVMFAILEKLGHPWAEYSQTLHSANLPLLGGSYCMQRPAKADIEDVLNKVKQRFQMDLQKNLRFDSCEYPAEIAEQLCLSSLKLFDLKHEKNAAFSFDIDEIVSFKKCSGSSFQFCHAGLKGLQEDSKFKLKDDIDTSPLSEKVVIDLILHLAKFDETIFLCYAAQDSYLLYHYLIKLWICTENVINKVSLDIKEERWRVIKARLYLLSATMKVLAKSLQIMGITPLESFATTKESFVQND